MISSKNYNLLPLTFNKEKKKKERQISNVNANAIFSNLMVSEVTLNLYFETSIFLTALHIKNFQTYENSQKMLDRN